MSKEIAVKYLEDSQRYLKLVITNLYSAIEELEELQSDDDEWNLCADIEEQIQVLKKIELFNK
jgi:hypothetical protein